MLMSFQKTAKRSSPVCSALIAAATVFSLTSAAFSQIAPDRTYYGITRAIPMTITVPAGAMGDVSLQLIAPASYEVVEKATAAAGAVNLAEKFPTLWTTSSPRLLYVQLLVGETKVGPAVVLQPLVTPNYAKSADGVGNPAWAPGPKVYSGVRAYVDKHVVLDTSKGEIELSLRPDMAPNTAWSFRELVGGGFYTEVIFHRIADLNADGTIDILQVGDPGAGDVAKAGSGGPGFNIDLERSTLAHDSGIISMARSQDPNSNGSQFFLCLNKSGTSFLDGKYTTFGETVRGLNVIKTLGTVQTNASARPIDPPMIKSAKLIDAPPIGSAATPAGGETKPDAKPDTKLDTKPAEKPAEKPADKR
ncbi:MAG: peptidylprolyl isomerase [Pyrinomonadaceae bacterium]|nr:peptidylprolyl isomerase [Phycisphaerales bacterium]